ncbi:hypothetical protein Taro_011594 [Colocasia esculenta]|uniref:FAR1 domain-containing protein n=1 Tax=Colocasia esculenta TaxID=4460 RepID=A0A843UAL2_COLES|nr:hypothetical protein [Colocasia esculenta]
MVQSQHGDHLVTHSQHEDHRVTHLPAANEAGQVVPPTFNWYNAHIYGRPVYHPFMNSVMVQPSIPFMSLLGACHATQVQTLPHACLNGEQGSNVADDQTAAPQSPQIIEEQPEAIDVPCNGMMFNSITEAHKFYIKYAKHEGFGISITDSRMKKGICIYKKFSCHRSGQPKQRKDAST